jgi:hypothetical protein
VVSVASFAVSNLEPLVVVVVVVFSADDEEEAFAVVVVGRRVGDVDIFSGLVTETVLFLIFPMMSLMFGVVVRTANMSVKFCGVRGMFSRGIENK